MYAMHEPIATHGSATIGYSSVSVLTSVANGHQWPTAGVLGHLHARARTCSFWIGGGVSLRCCQSMPLKNGWFLMARKPSAPAPSLFSGSNICRKVRTPVDWLWQRLVAAEAWQFHPIVLAIVLSQCWRREYLTATQKWFFLTATKRCRNARGLWQTKAEVNSGMRKWKSANQQTR